MIATNKKPNIKLPEKHYRWLLDHQDSRFVLMYGGASSAKSWTLSAFLILEKFLKVPNTGLLVVRKTFPSVRASCWRLMQHWLSELGVAVEANKSTLTLRAGNGSFVQFTGLDDVEKLKSIEGINYIWIEEATEVAARDLAQLHIRCRNPIKDGINQIYLTFNPVDPVGNAWLKRITDECRYMTYDVPVLKVTYLDNPMLAAEEKAAIAALIESDQEYDKIYRQGLWATPTNIIYTNWDTVESFPPDDDMDEIGYGLDFGYVNPSALLKVGIREKDVYVEEILYESKLHNEDLIAVMESRIANREATIIADSAEPAYIDEIAAAGFNVHATVKTSGESGKGFVKTGIDRCKRYRLHITQNSTNVIEEIAGYKWKVDKDENVLNEPVKFKDHAMDAMRYYVGTLREEAFTIDIGAYDGWENE